jgi:hypothetical protein
MQLVWVALAFGSAILLALALLYAFHARWYWHVLSVLGAGASARPSSGRTTASRSTAFHTSPEKLLPASAC